MQVWTEPYVSPAERRVSAVDNCRASAYHALARIDDVVVTRLQRVTVVTGAGLRPAAALLQYAIEEPLVVVVFATAADLATAMRALALGPAADRAALYGRVFTARQVADGHLRTAPYAGLVVPDWDAVPAPHRVALEADLRPLIAIGLRR